MFAVTGEKIVAILVAGYFATVIASVFSRSNPLKPGDCITSQKLSLPRKFSEQFKF
jgi:hypothetical protein